mmetsp:Transcript_9401/g.18310  ORF Transcript_9401/g.18310 Transcript_9401/m.18310 type:complete len:730 (+) Transcript_9401:149-2338(+)
MEFPSTKATFTSVFLLQLILFSVLVELSFCYVNNDNQILSSRKSIQILLSRVQVPTVSTALYSASTATPPASASKEESSSSNPAASSSSSIALDPDSIFDIIAGSAASCLLDSDKRRDAKAEHSELVSSSATNWINDETAFVLQKAIDRLKLKLAEERAGLDRDEASAWIRWMKSTPTPMIVDLSPELRVIANATMSDANFDLIEQSRTQFLSRMGARLILLPSGSSLSRPLREPPASLVYGKLLYGGVTRYRRLSSSNSRRPPRRTGERTATKVSTTDNEPAWIQYGGADRMYESLDIGSAAVLEIMLLPRGQALQLDMTSSSSEMIVQNCVWKPQEIFAAIPLQNDDDESGNGALEFLSGFTPISQAGQDRNDAFKADFKEDVGGLKPQIDAIVRRVLDGRVIRPAGEDDGLIEKDESTTALQTASLEAQELAILGLTPVRGLLLYGPPGTGKTLLARQIAKALRARAPKIVSAPELLDRWVGGSEKLVRELFTEAEAELAACNGDATRSALHVVVIDEIDAVFRRRSAGEDSGEQTRASVVNQILSKLDGVNAIDNILMIGMTNRPELLDSALLRPGRLEVQIEVPMPDRDGRREILKIHFGALRAKGRLSIPLCCAIDGIQPSSKYELLTANEAYSVNPKSDSDEVNKGRKRDALKRGISKVFQKVRPCYDLAAETEAFSGADIAGLVRSAGSLALSRARKEGSGVNDIMITLEDAKHAIEEVKK